MNIIVDENIIIVDKNVFVVDKIIFVVDENVFIHDDFPLKDFPLRRERIKLDFHRIK